MRIEYDKIVFELKETRVYVFRNTGSIDCDIQGKCYNFRDYGELIRFRDSLNMVIKLIKKKGIV